MQLGYPLFDTAEAREWYRQDILGSILQKKQSKALVISKLHPRDFSPVKARQRFVQTLEELRRDTIDVYLLHSPVCWKGHCKEDENVHWEEAWKVLEEIYEKGQAKAIGVSNFNAIQLKALLELSSVKPHIVQNWMDPLHQDKEVRSICKSNEIMYIAYSTMGNQWRKTPNPVLFHPLILELAASHNTTPASVVLSWALQVGVGVIPKSTKAEHIRDNISIRKEIFLQVFLTDEEMSFINAL